MLLVVLELQLRYCNMQQQINHLRLTKNFTTMAMISFNQWKNSPEAILQCTFFVHFLFSAWSELGAWSGNALLIQNFFFLLSLMWAMHARSSPTPVLLAMGINVLSIILDIIVLAVGFPKGNSTREFSGVMAIFNLILRVVSTFLLFKSLEQRDELDGPIPARPKSGAPSVIEAIVVGTRDSVRCLFALDSVFSPTKCVPCWVFIHAPVDGWRAFWPKSPYLWAIPKNHAFVNLLSSLAT
eukprot:maker-scaffold386_size188734-snap-gene-0.21 protein:Tk02423 transcript:maker-scaffold386_size188734-snap-gene-0.21-mRNA-1 annotation:"type-1 angiotensin ii receptor-associated protein"